MSAMMMLQRQRGEKREVLTDGRGYPIALVEHWAFACVQLFSSLGQISKSADKPVYKAVAVPQNQPYKAMTLRGGPIDKDQFWWKEI